MERMRKYVMIAIGLVVAGAGVAGFLKSRNGVDVADADAKLKTWAEANVAPVDKVTCPEAKLKKGNTFDCKVDFVGGKSYALHVVVTSDDGMVEYSWVTPISTGERLAANIASAVKTQQGKDVALDCGKGIVEIPAAGLVCSATLGDQHGHLRVKFDANAKQIVWAVEP
jgi:hypothetical protein